MTRRPTSFVAALEAPMSNEAVRSIHGSLRGEDQLLVVALGELDASSTVDPLLAGVQVLGNPGRPQLASCLNQGAAAATNAIVVFVAGQAVPHGNLVERVHEAFEDPRTGMALPRAMPTENPWCALRRECFASAGGFRAGKGGLADGRAIMESLRENVALAGWEVVSLEPGPAPRPEGPLGSAPESQRPPLVSLCMIVRDEEDTLPACIDSVQDLVDEIVIYDTGSTDGTVELARGLGATVLEGHWSDDFAEARNSSLGHCHGKWVLWLDADEVLAGDLGALRDRLAWNLDSVPGYALRIENLLGAGLGGRSVHVACRLFRRAVGHWVGRLHEQVMDRATGEYLSVLRLPDAHIVHRGYLDSVFTAKNKTERNLHIAQLELQASPDRSYALMNLGRTLMLAGRLEEAHLRLTEAAASSDNPATRRFALRVDVDVLLGLGKPDAALGVARDLRRSSDSAIPADIAEGRCLIALGRVEHGLAVLDRIDSDSTDDDGFEYGPHSVAALKGSALAGQGRYGEAADLVLDAVRTHGALDLHLGQLATWLIECGRDPAEIALVIEQDAARVLAAQCSQVSLPVADSILDALATRFPGALATLVAAARIAPHLPVTRALAWSARLRAAGLPDKCPLACIIYDSAVDRRVRLRAAAAMFTSFGDQRAIAAAEELLEGLGRHDDVMAELSRLSPRLAGVLSGTAQDSELLAVNVGCGDDRRVGYVNIDLRADVADLVGDVGHLPMRDGSVRELLAFDILEHVSAWRTPQLLGEWFRVLAPSGRLVLRVPNLEMLGRHLADPVLAESMIQNIYGGHRFGPDGAWDAHHTGWTPCLAEEMLQRAGFEVRANDQALNMTIVAERTSTRDVVARDRRSAKPLPASVILPVHEGAKSTERFLRSLASTDAGAEFELIVVDNASRDLTPLLLEAVSGDVTVVRNEADLGPARACNQGAARADSPVVVFVSNDIVVTDGWLGALLSALARSPDAAAAGGILRNGDGAIVRCGFRIDADPSRGSLTVLDRAQNPLVAPWELQERCSIQAVGRHCLAVTAEAFRAVGGFDEGYWYGCEDLDLCLALLSEGRQVLYEPSASLVLCPDDAQESPRADHNRRRLADRWSRRIAAAPTPPARPTTRSLVEPPEGGGLNVIGYFDAACGIGQVARSLVSSARAATIPVAATKSHRHSSPTIPVGIDDARRCTWDTTVVVARPSQYLGVVEEIGLDAFRDRYIIGMWCWDLQVPSPDMEAASRLLHEVWVGSEFVANAVRQVVDRPVTVIPVPVAPEPPTRAPVSRADIGMPGGFVFACSFDFASWAERKNPFGAVEAFREAFRPGEGPSLYLKTMNGSSHYPQELARLLELAAGRPDVVVVDACFDPARAHAVTSLADCYVSLHRAEGLALSLAEAMAAGTPVVATGYSGNLEFMNESNASLVPYRLVEVPPAPGPYRPGALWAEPDLDAAAKILHGLWADYPIAAERANAAKEGFDACRSEMVTGVLMRRRLEEIAAARYGHLVRA